MAIYSNQTQGQVPPQNQAPAPQPDQEEIKNLKAEMNRKLTNTEVKLDELTRVSQVLAEQLQYLNKPKEVPVDNRKLADLALEDPEAYSRIIEDRATKAAEKRIVESQNYQAKQNKIFSDIATEFPEATNPSHELTKRAGEIFATLDDGEKHDPKSYKQVVFQAASELGIKPKSRRKEGENDDFTLGNKGTPQRVSKKLEPQIDDVALAFAKALGRPVDDPKYLERLKAHANRNYNEYE